MSDTTTPREPSTKPENHTSLWHSRRASIVAIAGAAVAVAVLAGISRPDPLADLLSWLPADDMTRRAFAVWTPDPGAATPQASAQLDLIDSLNLAPEPGALGRPARWDKTFGWDASQVTAAPPPGRMGRYRFSPARSTRS